MSVPWDVGKIIHKRALSTPNKSAVIFEDQPYTFSDLNRGANRFAHYLNSQGMNKGDRLVILSLNCPEYLEVYFACAKLGIVLVPLNWRLVGPELDYQINDCQARMCVFQDAFLANVDTIRGSLPVDADKYVYMKGIMPGLPGCPEWAGDYAAVVSGMPETEPEPTEDVYMEDPLAIVYTSGVTGAPKGAVLSHGQTYFKNMQVALYTRGGPDDVVLAQLPLFHSGGLFIVATPSIMGGTTMIMRAGFDPNQFAEDIEKYRANVVFALTTMWRFILDSGKLDQVNTASVHSVVGGGERTPKHLFDELAKRGLYMQQGFGQTECSAMTVMPKEDIQRKMGSVGRPGFFVQIWVQDARGNPLPPGEIGEIMARGPTVMSGYWNLPEKTREVLVDGRLNTGDLGYMDEEGFLYIVDRARDMYRSGGENVYPAEIEKVIVTHPKVANAAIVGVPDEKWSETGMAFIQPLTGQEVSEKEIRDFLQGKVAKYKYPMYIRFVDDLPLTATMKVRKAALKEKAKKIMEAKGNRG
ncbi:MAG: class I adenylate-forming enzyme family protein [Desulfatibacillaceae bacterium]